MQDWDRMYRNSSKAGHFAGLTHQDEDAYYAFFATSRETHQLTRLSVWIRQTALNIFAQLHAQITRVICLVTPAGRSANLS